MRRPIMPTIRALALRERVFRIFPLLRLRRFLKFKVCHSLTSINIHLVVGASYLLDECDENGDIVYLNLHESSNNLLDFLFCVSHVLLLSDSRVKSDVCRPSWPLPAP